MKLSELSPRVVRLGVAFRGRSGAMTPEQRKQKKLAYQRKYRAENGRKPRRAR